MVGPPAAARCVVTEPSRAIVLSVLFALGIVWAAIALAYVTTGRWDSSSELAAPCLRRWSRVGILFAALKERIDGVEFAQ